MSFDDFNYFFGGVDGNARILTPADKQRLSDLFSNAGRVFADVSVNDFSAMYKANPNIGAFAFSMVDYIGVSFTVPKSIVDLGLNGNQTNQVYSFNDAATKSWWIREYSLSYARELPEIDQKIFDKIAVGVSIKMVNGFSYVGMDHINTTFKHRIIKTRLRKCRYGRIMLLFHQVSDPFMILIQRILKQIWDLSLKPQEQDIGFDLGCGCFNG